MRLVDLDNEYHAYKGKDGDYEVWYIDPAETVKSPMQFTPCSKKYPDVGQEVLVILGYHDYHVWTCMSDTEDDHFWEDEYGYWHNKYEVDGWIPLD